MILKEESLTSVPCLYQWPFKEAILTLFADDPTFGKKTPDVVEIAKMHSEELIEWTRSNQLKLDPSISLFINYSQSDGNAIALASLVIMVLPSFWVLPRMKN